MKLFSAFKTSDKFETARLLLWVGVFAVILVTILYAVKGVKRFFGFDTVASGTGTQEPQKVEVIVKGGETTTGADGTTVKGPIRQGYSDDIGRYVTQLHDLLSKEMWLMGFEIEKRCKTYGLILGRLNDSELAVLAQSYETTFGSRLADVIEQKESGCGWFGTGWKAKILERLNKAGV